MAHDGREGSIEVITGVMFSGKSEELLRRVRRALIARKAVQVFKSHLDDRYSGIHAISSHDGRRVEARPISSSYTEIAINTQSNWPIARSRTSLRLRK